MHLIKKQLSAVFAELNDRIEALNRERRDCGLGPFQRSKAHILGQTSLMVHDRISVVLSLAQTADLDARLEMEHAVKVELKKILKTTGLVYDEDSYLIWIPPGAKFEPLF